MILVRFITYKPIDARFSAVLAAEVAGLSVVFVVSGILTESELEEGHESVLED